MISVLSPGARTLVRDAGREGYMRFGLSRCGAADTTALAHANLLAGNAPFEGAIEATLVAPSLRFEQDALFAVTGAECTLTLGGRTVRQYEAVAAHAGETLVCGAITRGCRVYIAFAGGLGLKKALGSVSCDARAGIGGLKGGEPLKRGDVIPVHTPEGAMRLAGRRLPENARDYIPGDTATLRFVPGVQADALSREGYETFCSCEYTVSAESDSMGLRFAGESAAFAPGHDGNIITDAILPGAIQLPPSGLPILMLCDAQTTGGYEKPAIVIGADMPAAGQLRPGTRVRFAPVSLSFARDALLELNARLRALEAKLEPHALRVSVNGKIYEISVTETFSY